MLRMHSSSRAFAGVVLVLLAASPVSAGTAPVTLPAAPNCPIFPSSNVWNKPVDGLDVAGNSGTLMRSIGLESYLHPDFSSIAGGNYGIPINVVGSGARRVNVRFRWPGESDPNPYLMPRNPKFESGSDRHLIVVDRDACKLYELFAMRKTSTGWRAGSGAKWDLRSNALRPDGWTSADAAGLPILPGLARYPEVAAGEIRHALRFTVPSTRSSYIYPARHFASASNDPALPPMGVRLRLKDGVDISAFGPQ
ncbi:MAG TPA: hypothetical protein VMZ33_04355, partial [Candidatus Limnocylindrales bacterium]|nr:hypothetical protein [Candidatus Limnocylindrales bacterium]